MRLPAETVILARLEWRRVLAFWRNALRDPVFDFAVVAGLVVIYYTLRRAWHVAHGQPSLTLALLGAGFGVLLCAQVHPGPNSKLRQDLTNGPFHMLVCAPGVMDRWILTRDAVLCGAAITAMAIVLATFSPLFGLAFWLTTSLGAAGYAAFSTLPAPPRPAPTSTTKPPRQPSPYRHRSPLITIALAAQRRGPVPTWVIAAALVALSAAAGALAAANNHAPVIGQYVAAAGAFLAGALMLPGGRLPGILGQQPLSFLRLYAWLYAAPLAMAALGGLAGGLIVGLGPVGALETASISLVGLFVLGWMHFLTRMIRSERNTPFSTGLEFVGSLMMAAVENSLAPLFILARGVILVRAARRRRWLDR